MEKNPEKIIIIGLIEKLWNSIGKSSASVWREIGQRFTDEFEQLGMDMSTPEASLKSVKKYFTETFDFAENVKYEIGDEEILLTLENCVLRPITDHFEAQGIPRLPCYYANSSVIALEKPHETCTYTKKENHLQLIFAS